MHLIVYTSQATFPLKRMPNVLPSIIAASRRNNLRNELTGVMFEHRGRFLQFLEGPQQKVLNTFERIAADSRHTNVEILFDSPIRERGCPNWAMDALDLPKDADLCQDQLKLICENYSRNFIVQTDTILSIIKGFLSESSSTMATANT